MTREEAIRALGLPQDTLPSRIEAAHKEKRRDLIARIKLVSDRELKAQLRSQLDALDVARRIALQVEESGAVQEPRAATPNDAGEKKPAQKPQPGQMLMNRYEVRKRIAAGGMGEVYLAHDHTLSETIAIKVLHTRYLDNQVIRLRFFEEAKISISLTHPNIVNVFDLQKDEDLHFLTMELLHGHSLRDEVAQRLKKKERFTIPEVQSIAEAMCAGLAYAHRYIVHRDIKPENVWLCADGTVKIMDFGIARLHTLTRCTLTTAGMGTAFYMSPEQMKGAKDLDHRADQYSTAVVIYELLTGDVPTGRMEPACKLRADVPKKMSDAIDKALSVDPADRFPSIEAFAEALCGDSPECKKKLFQ